MLETSLFESGGSARTRKPVTLLMSTVIHLFVVIALVLIPILQPQVVPMLSAAVGIPLTDAPKPEPNPRHVEVAPAIQPHIQLTPDNLVEPLSIPHDIAVVVDEPVSPPFSVQTSPGQLRSVLNALQDKQPAATPPPPPPPPPAPVVVAGPLRVSSGTEAANLIHQVKPEYPSLARRAHVQGVVVLEATIARDGSVQNLRIVSGNPLLNDAARDAVQQWRYKPTMLDGEPIEVITTITVTFTLQ